MQQLQNLVERLAQARVTQAAAKAARAAATKAVLETELGKAQERASWAYTDANKSARLAKETVVAAALTHFDDDPIHSKHPLPGITITDTSPSLHIEDETEALDWCRTNAPLALSHSVDPIIFEALVEAGRVPPHIATMVVAHGVRIAGDLSQYLEEEQGE